MSKSLTIRSHKGEYQVSFHHQMTVNEMSERWSDTAYYIVDKKIAALYPQLEKIIQSPSTLLIDATEANKSLDQLPHYVNHFVNHKIRRGHRLVAIGGGIIQDITCFLSAIMLRGLDWSFFPTTLLAQADSCIGSKSSINCQGTKNILGTYTPPQEIMICTDFLKSLEPTDVASGIGEMLKIHGIDSIAAFEKIAQDYDKIISDHEVMISYIYDSLKMKQKFIEQDEFDRNIRLVLNYGHTFGHAIETATQYHIPHGVAVTLGVDMANYAAAELGLGTRERFHKMHATLKKNYSSFIDTEIPIEVFMQAITKDKKNTGANQIGLILPDKSDKLDRVFVEKNEKFIGICERYFDQIRQT